jgi:YggT family protein
MVDVLRGLTAYALEAVDILVKVLILAVVTLVVLRWLLMKVSPFGWASFQIRRLTDPILWPFSQALPVSGGMGVASLLLVLATVLAAYFFKWVMGDVLRALLGVIEGISAGTFVGSLGWLLYGAISVLLVLIVVRIVLSWMPFARDSWLMWTLYGLTEPIMAPFRRIIPPLGMIDLSPIILILLLNFAQSAIYSVLIR